jgi:hypothetical protein
VSFPSFAANPRYWGTVKIGGRLILAPLREVDGMKLEGDWSEQKPTGTSGASFTWKGLKPAGPHKLTFETAYGPSVTPQDCEDDMRVVHEMMLPQPSIGSGSATQSTPTATPATPTAPPAPTTAEGLLQQAQQALKNLDNPAKEKDPTAGTTGTSTAPKADANPGPRPPTLSIENGFVNYVGTTAGSLKSFEVKVTKTNSLQFVIELVPQKALAPAGTGLAPAKSPDQQGLTPAQRAATQQALAQADAATLASGAGT